MLRTLLTISIIFCSLSVLGFAQEELMDSWPKFAPYGNPQADQSVSEWEFSLENIRCQGMIAPKRYLSVDRFADKYPHLSPYHYTANNPLNFIDINGDSLKIVGDEKQRQRALDAIRQGLPPEVRDAVQLIEINGKYFISDIALNDAKGKTKSPDFLSLRQIVNSPGMGQLQIVDDNVQFQYFDKSVGESVSTSFTQLGESFQGITFTTDIANTIYDRTNIVSNEPGVNQSFVRSPMSMENIVQLTAHELYGHIHPHLMGKRSSHHRVGDSFDQNIKLIMQRAVQNFKKR